MRRMEFDAAKNSLAGVTIEAKFCRITDGIAFSKVGTVTS